MDGLHTPCTRVLYRFVPGSSRGGHYHRPRVTICDRDQDEIKRSSRFPGENQTIKVDFQARIKRSKSLVLYYTCTYAVSGVWILVGGANEAGRASRQGSRNQAMFFK